MTGTWKDISAELTAERAKRKSLIIPLGTHQATFVIRQLTQAEEDRIKAKMSMKFSRDGKSPEIPMDLSESKIATFKTGVISGPDGFDPHNEKDIRELPAWARDEIVGCIEDFSTLPDEVRLKFRGRGTGGEGDPDN